MTDQETYIGKSHTYTHRPRDPKQETIEDQRRTIRLLLDLIDDHKARIAELEREAAA